MSLAFGGHLALLAKFCVPLAQTPYQASGLLHQAQQTMWLTGQPRLFPYGPSGALALRQSNSHPLQGSVTAPHNGFPLQSNKLKILGVCRKLWHFQ